MRRSLGLLAVVGALAASASAAPALAATDRPLRSALRAAAAEVDWTNLAPAERRRVLRRWARTPPMFDALLARIAPRMSVRRTFGDEIAQGNFTEQTLGDDDERPWRVSLSHAVLIQGSKLGAHITLHELGHVVDGELGTDLWRGELVGALARSPLWARCWPMPPGSSSRCVVNSEVIADQFAFWATARREVRSSYWVPPLLQRAQLGAWFARLLPRELRDPRGFTTRR